MEFFPLPNPRLVVVLGSNEPRGNLPGPSTADSDIYVVAFDDVNGQQIHRSRSASPGNQFPLAVAQIYDPSELVIVGQTDGPIDGQTVNGPNDVFVTALSSNFSVAVPPTLVPLSGSQRVGGVARNFVGRSVTVGGGTDGTSVAVCGGAYHPFDSMVLRVAFAGSTASVSNLFVTQSPSALAPIQIDDWIDAVGAGGRFVATVARQFDCFGGGAGYINNDSVQIALLETNGFGAFRSKVVPGFTGRASVANTGEANSVLEDYHLFADGSAWKFDYQLRSEAFGVSVPQGLASVSPPLDGVAWIGNAGGISLYLLK